MNELFSAALFLMSFRLCLSQKAIDLGTIDCSFYLPSKCRYADVYCTAHCSDPCLRYKDIWGTAIYTYDSPICRAAVHDLRISTWNDSARTVIFQYSYDKKEYIGSKRQHIGTLDYGRLNYSPNGCYYFKNPRITEEILDIISLHHNYIFKDGKTHWQECRVSSNAVNRKISFSTFSDGKETEASPNYRGSQIYYTKYWNQVDGFWCRPDHNMLSGILSHVMPEDTLFIPPAFTITTSIKDKIIIQMNQTKYTSFKIWRKNGNEFSGYLNQFFGKAKGDLKLSFESVKIGDAGFYSLDNYNLNKRGIIRLIVRVCKDGLFGPLCEYNCPTCLNGGVCHDLTGDCICPPGFNGTRCENACQPGFFGRDCSQQCYNEQNEVTNCAEILFCLPDPYGCSCISGFTSYFCNQTCGFGFYGAGCKQTCSTHCRNSETCEPATGKCVKGCEDGWHGASCLLSYPVFKLSPVIKEITANSIQFTFKEWEMNKDKGVGIPDYYMIQYKNNVYVTSEWIDGEKIKANNGSDEDYDVTIDNLFPDTTYVIRVIIIDISGNKQLTNVPVIIRKTMCGVPKEPPKNIIFDATQSRVIVITWELPPQETWNCKDISVEIFYNTTTTERSFENIKKNSFEIQTDPYTKWNVALRTVNENFSSKWSTLKSVVSAQEAPSKVTNLAVITNTSEIYVTWDKPEKENGILIKYVVKYQQTSWRDYCNLINSTELTKEIDANETSVNLDVYPYSNYRLKVFAVTIRPGPENEATFETEESVPAAPPINLRIISTETTRVHLKWDTPICNLSFGKVIEYHYVLKSLDPWEIINHFESVTVLQTVIENLYPFTTYKIQIYAGTKIGYSNYSADLNFTTKSDKPLAPTELIVYRSTESILALSWIPPYPPRGRLWKYGIQYYCQRCVSNTVTVYVNQTKCIDEIREDHHCYTLSGLKENQKYTIQIAAFNEDVYKMGAEATISAETKESKPDPPDRAWAENVTEHSFNIIWLSPYKTNGNLTNYRINITAVDSYNTEVIGSMQMKITDSNTRNCIFTDLHPATVYNTTIEASTKIGYGKPLYMQFATKNSEPVIELEPEITGVTDTTVNMTIKPIHFDEGPIDAYFVMVKRINRRKKRLISETKLLSYNESRKVGSDEYAAAKFFPEEIDSTGMNFTVGDGKSYNDFYNPPLITGEKYKIGVAVSSNFKGEERIGYKYLSEAVTVKKPEHFVMKRSNAAAIIISILAVLTILILIIIFIIYRRNPKLLKYIPTLKDFNVKNAKQERISITLSTDNLEELAELEPISEIKSQKIPVSELENFVQNGLKTGEIRKQFVSVEKGQNQSWEMSKKPENKGKNRYGNLLAYDATRVILQKLPNDPNSDYINANYIDGYNAPKKYIATQGPKPLTVKDFWRMIWQENVCKIIMSTNLIENGKTKCEKYWPDSFENYGDITVNLTDSEIFADYVIRTFNIIKENEVREIKHFHFNTWPDHGVPMYAIAVSNFIEKTRSYNSGKNNPIVFHCSAGIGRTGTLILIDSMLDMAAEENHVDLVSHLHIMRQQRINMVETLDQYNFVYQCLVESLCGEKTSIPCSEYIPTLNRFKTVDPLTGHTTFHVQFNKLAKLCPPLKVTDCRTASDPRNQGKNRNNNILPPDRSRPILKVWQGDPESSYINAVYVNGYRQLDAFLVTQIPFPETKCDFWRMTFFSKSSTIVLLNDLDQIDETCEPYWPEETETYSDIEVQKVSEEKNGDITIRIFELKNNSMEEESKQPNKKVIKQFHLSGWMPNETLPTSADIIINLIDKVQRWQQQSGTSTVIVQCLNGVRACGLYCSSVFVCDKIKSEQEVDIFLAVRSIRANRPQFIEDVGQYIYCHQVALSFLDEFQIYANFQ